MKLKWKVSDVPIGPYRSFQQRAWPQAWYSETGQLAAAIACEDEYKPANVREGKHAPLKVYVYDYSDGVQHRICRVLIRQFATLDEAKATAERFLINHPEYAPERIP